jgi:hypothetical protein
MYLGFNVVPSHIREQLVKRPGVILSTVIKSYPSYPCLLLIILNDERSRDRRLLRIAIEIQSSLDASNLVLDHLELALLALGTTDVLQLEDFSERGSERAADQARAEAEVQPVAEQSVR